MSVYRHKYSWSSNNSDICTLSSTYAEPKISATMMDISILVRLYAGVRQ